MATTTDRSKNFRSVEIPVPWGIIAGKEWGDPNGHPWLGLHGWLDNAGSLDNIAKDWPAGHKLVAIDTPGHGLSSHLPPGAMYHYLEATIDIERIARHYNWERFSIVGHSMGAGMGFCYTGAFPDKVKSLIMIDLMRPFVRHGFNTADRVNSSVTELLSLEERFDNMHGKVYSSYEEVLQRLTAEAKGKDGTPNVSDEGIRIMMERGVKKSDCGTGWVFTRDLRRRVQSLYGLTSQSLDELAQNIRCPHLLIKATGSIFYEPKEYTENALNEYRKNEKFQYRLLEGKHHLHLDSPEVVMPVIRDFIEETYKTSNL